MSEDGDDYVPVTATIKGITEKAVNLGDDTGHTAWIPRSCLHGFDDIRLRRDLNPGDEHTFKIRRWIAEREDMA